MNRNGLAIALAVAAVVGALFGVCPQLDLDLSAPFFDPKAHLFAINLHAWAGYSRDAARWLVAFIAAAPSFAMLGKIILPRRRMLMTGRGAWFLLVSLAVGPGILANEILKDHWGRARPIDVVEFGGTVRFTPWWDPRGPCPNNCSFIAGEPSGAFWTLAPAALAPPQWRPVAYGAALVFGAGIGALRIAGGGHFFTDVVFAGVLMFLTAWTVHGLIYRWRPTRISDKEVEHPLAVIGEAIRNAVAALIRRIAGHTGGPS